MNAGISELLDENAFRDSSLCVVGNINRDVKTAPLAAGEHLFRDGETAVRAIVETIGGGGANSAFAAASLGARVTFLGKIGADGLGGRIERTLQRHGIDARLARDAAHASGTSLALAFDNGCRHFLSCLPASRALSFADLDLSALAGHRHLLRADVWFSESMLYEGNKLLFQAARQAGVAVSLDLNWDPHWGRGSAVEIRSRKQAVRDVLPWVNLAHGNARELMELADASELPSALQRVVDWGAEAVIVHLGDQGAGCFQCGEFLIEPPVPAQTHVNTTGTGDVLSVCTMLLHHLITVPMRERLRLANAVVSQFIEGKRQMIPTLVD
jgi:sugar/nucleoside kinase (ribokinase family)